MGFPCAACHDRADVAVIRVQWSTFTLHSVYPEQFIDADYNLRVQEMREAGLIQLPGIISESSIKIEAGNDVSIIGLFVKHYGQGKSLPVARSGTIARMLSEPVEFAHPGGAYIKATAYLVEFRSWGGQSGSPVLVHRQLFHLVQVQVHPIPADDVESRPQMVWVQSPRSEAFGLLGLVSGHFDIKQQAQSTGEIPGSITTAINSGIAIVTPAEAIRELLWREDVVEDRQRAHDDAAQERAQGKEYATPSPRRILHNDVTE